MRNPLLIIAMLGCQLEQGRPVPLEDLSSALGTVYCDRMFECFSAAERREQSFDHPDPFACTSWFIDTVDPAIAQLARWIAQGHMTYDARAATACLSTLDAASCGEVRLGIDYAMRNCRMAFRCMTPSVCGD